MEKTRKEKNDSDRLYGSITLLKVVEDDYLIGVDNCSGVM